MLLEGIFNGGSQSGSAGQPASPNQPSAGNPPANDTAANDPAPPPASSAPEADPIYDEAPGENDDGTYAGTPDAGQEEASGPVDNGAPVEGPVESGPGQAEPVADGAPSGNQPPSDTPANGGAADSAAPPAPGQPSSPPPTAAIPAPSQGVSPAPADEIEPAEDERREAVRDFVGPLLADLASIRQRQTEGAASTPSQSRNRAIAAIQDQLASRLLDEIASGTSKSGGSSPVAGDKADAEAPVETDRPLSLVNRWYFEA